MARRVGLTLIELIIGIAVLGVAGEVVKAVQEGHLKHIFLVGGCDGHGEGGGRGVVGA